MNINWFKNPDNVVYSPAEEFAKTFGKEAGIPDLKEQLEAFRDKPEREGRTLTGRKRTSVKLLVPNLYFGQEIQMGENVWVYLGENYESYCIFWPMA